MKEWAFDIRSVVPGTVIEYPDFYSQLFCSNFFPPKTR